MNKTILTSLLLVAAGSAFANTPLPDVAPASQGQHVYINVPQQRLFLYTNGKLTKVYKVTVGKPSTPTTLGKHNIGVKAFNPTWHIPKSIQKERKDGAKTVPPGPNNPLGPVFVRLGNPKLGLGIHGTNAPSSVPGVRSHGCVRMKSPDALEFAKTIATGSPAEVIYQMASLNTDGAGNLWLAAYRDPYKQNNLDTAALRKSIEAWSKANPSKKVNMKRVAAVLKNRTGQANCLTCTKGEKLKNGYRSLNWTAGSAALSKPMPMPKPKPVTNDTLPEGTQIEVDVDTPAPATQPAVDAVPQSTPPATSLEAAPSAAPADTVSPTTVPTVATPKVEVDTPTEDKAIEPLF